MIGSRPYYISAVFLLLSGGLISIWPKLPQLRHQPASPVNQFSAPIQKIINLSEKEITILKLMCEEKTTKEIADIVEISPRTVEAIRDKLKTKTGAKSMAGLVMYALKSGIIQEQ